MMKLQYFSCLLLLGFAGAASIQQGGGSPCAQVSQASRVAAAANTTPTVAAKLAYDCLTSTPLDASAATALMKSLLPYVEWQTDISYLKRPPKGYQVPGIDIWRSLDDISSNIKRGRYSNEHVFLTDLFSTFNRVHDGHFRFLPDLLSKAVQFRRPVQLVSVSRDGLEVPKVYIKEDMANFTKNRPTRVSPVRRINGEDAEDFLQKLSLNGFLQNPDALYNNLFYELALDAQFTSSPYTGYFAGSGRAGNIYPGPETKIQFENGTTKTYQNYARVIGDFNGVTDGPSMYRKFCTGPSSAPVDDADFPTKRDTGKPTGYPEPQSISSDKQVAGYFLDGDPDYEDVAVLSMLSFEPKFPAEFQIVIQNFISDAKAAGKTKMIIDLSGNGGGIILNGYDAFRQFFPHIVQDGFTRFREHDAFDIMSRQISNFTSGFKMETASTNEVIASQSVLDYRSDLNLTNQRFQSYEDKFTPQNYNGDKFTSILRWNLSDPLLTTSYQWGLGMTITGYGDRQNFEQPFAAKDIIIVYDGSCASTCTIFSEFMSRQGGVKSIAMGGLPNRRPIQAIGGTKGTNNYPFSYILALADIALETATPQERAKWTSVAALNSLPLNRSTDTSINVRDNILKDNLKDGTPAQFLYEEADCRLFYEPEMLKDVGAIWKKAAAAAWGDAKCVAGRLPHQREARHHRRRKSEDMKTRARSEQSEASRPVWKGPESIPKGPRNPFFGKKVPV
ncbi:ClpP [Venustampulla echinocandica]|uniref:ClpP n=1 Tax=Venustampulla echinocandica TaxID=2656787 RepID=A0A370TU04_9HELO|nr:ClpP [Venustampulla echinocandica]RDL38990.1 ClpP [Venustampulla echinocandica]